MRKRVLKVVEEKSSYETSLFLEGLEEKLGFQVEVIQTDNIKYVIEKKGNKNMWKTKKHAFDALNIIWNCIINLSGNVTGDVLLTNTL